MKLDIFLHGFIFIFLASLPGRTTFLMMIMAAHAEMKKVLIGACLAFAAQCAISVLMGNILSVVSKGVLHILVGALFIYFGYHFWQASRRKEKFEGAQAQVTISNVFSVVFAGEWGDVSQVAIASYSAEHSEKMIVLGAALIALWSTVIIAVCVGRMLHHAMRPQKIQFIAAIGFACAGIYMLAQSIFS